MPASYPAAIREFTTKRNLIDIVWAEHMNSMQDETNALQTTLGLVPQIATNNPGHQAPDHGTVAARIQHVARGEQIPIFRGSTREATVTPNVWVRPSLRADDDAFSMSTGTGIKLCESGLWAFTIKADWKSTGITVQQEATRMARLEIDGVDIGVRHVMQEQPHNRYAMHNTVTWIDTFSEDTVVSMGVRTDCGGNPGPLLYNSYLRAHLVRCHPEGEGGSLPFDDIPDVVKPPPDVVVRPPANNLKYTVLVTLTWIGGRHDYETGVGSGPPGAAAHYEIIDSTHPKYNSSPYPKFNSMSEARAFIASQQSNSWGNDYYAYSPPVTGTISW
jgi:hypothetical protein